MDRKNRADDNAEALFKYAAPVEDGIKKYFVVLKESSDFERIAQYGTVVPFGSDEHKLLLLFAEKYVSSHAFINECPFNSEQLGYVNMVLRTKHIFLQHGITKDDVSVIWNKQLRNFSLFITAGKLEYQEVLSSRYGYNSDSVKLTGFPRFDALKSNPENTIIFMPTWRRDLALPNQTYDPAFKTYPFFQTMNSFLTSDKLENILKKYYWTLLLKLHPEMVRQSQDFTLSDTVHITDDSYQALYEKGSILVTDYSSAVFDFAYLKKPVLYYHAYKTHYDSSYFDYETMGFGEIAYTADGLVDAIEKLMQGGCQMEEKYQKRVDDFFAFTDRDNCRRVYEEICRIPGTWVEQDDIAKDVKEEESYAW
jgi:CDP-glycerol glycerophosphotransferase (TagB/SpsB family)